ncbi:MAG: DEAD/DEAH box helicase [Archangiaceae bacterium]|nr:DEAD/DEAH box helicase [Archangiaceae bacterium]
MTSPTVTLSPAGHLLLTEHEGPEHAMAPRLAALLREAWAQSPAHGLLSLGLDEPEVELPPVWRFWRERAVEVIAAACIAADIENQREKVELPADLPALERAAGQAPPMPGGEYLTPAVLVEVHHALAAALKAALAQSRHLSVQQFFAEHHERWHVLGRVHFHLAENRRDPERPFAFLATYTTGVSERGAAQHRPLGDAVRESASARDKARLLALLEPVKHAASSAPYVRELVDSGKVFRPLAWTPRDAHRFLKELPALEQSGVIVRVPDWWKARAPPRPQVSISLGNKEPNAVGLDALLDFDVRLTLAGAPLTDAELEALKAANDGLVLLKGRWVEVDRNKLDQLLSHWSTVQQAAGAGLSYAEAMRLLSGVRLGDALDEATPVEPETQAAWSQVTAGPWLSKTLAAMREQGGRDVEVGDALKAELRPYQREGVRWLWLLSQLHLGACLADDMGLGKTVQVLALLLAHERRARTAEPHLLVVPASLLANWKGEAERFAPSLEVVALHPSELDLSHGPPPELERARVALTSYATLQRTGWMLERKWGLVVLDEAQAIKNPGAKQTRAVKRLQGAGRIALTGTPVENRVTDLWSIFDFLNPGLLGSAKQFGTFVRDSASFAPLRELTRPYILRRLKTDRAVISDLPEKTEVPAFCTLTRRQAVLYQQSVDALAKELRGAREGIERRGVVLSYLMRFKQICNHPSQWLADGAFKPEDSGKHQKLAELCETIAAKQEKVLVFTQFRQLTEPLAAWLKSLFGRPGLQLSGQTQVKRRQELVRRFQDDEQVPFFVLSLKAGGTGLNLTAASHVIHFDRWWNPAVENQATDRAFRIGQKRNVLVHKFVCRGTVEERVDALIAQKQGVARELLEGESEVKLSELSDGELMRMVSLDMTRARAEA